MSVLSFVSVILMLGIPSTIVAGLKCDAVKPYFETHGFPASDIPKEPISCEFISISLFFFFVVSQFFRFVEILRLVLPKNQLVNNINIRKEN